MLVRNNISEYKIKNKIMELTTDEIEGVMGGNRIQNIFTVGFFAITVATLTPAATTRWLSGLIMISGAIFMGEYFNNNNNIHTAAKNTMNKTALYIYFSGLSIIWYLVTDIKPNYTAPGMLP